MVQVDPGLETLPFATLPQTRQMDFVSRITGRAYRLQVALPLAPPPDAGYRVLYIIDGDMHFGTYANAMRMRAFTGELEAAIVVGIAYPEAETDILAWLRRRNTDLTPTEGGDAMRQNITRQLDGLSIDAFGDAHNFLAAIETEIAPLIARIAPVDTGRNVLFGHSLGGLFTLFAMFTQPTAFETYLALSPSIWWDQNALLAHESAFVRQLAEQHLAPKLFLGVGEFEQVPDKTPRIPANDVLAAAMVDNMTALAARLSAIKPRIELTAKIYPGQTHMGVATTAVSDILEFAFGTS